MLLTEDEIIDIGKQARAEIKEPHGYCSVASKIIIKEIKSRYGDKISGRDISMKEVIVDKQQNIRHYVVKINSEYIVGSSYPGSHIIDVTLDQYCSENKKKGKVNMSFGSRNSIDEINIFTYEEAPYTN